MTEFSDDAPERKVVRARCVEPTSRIRCGVCKEYGSPQEYPMHAHGSIEMMEDTGCGWTGSAIALTSCGKTELSIDACPECSGSLEIIE